ncbi:tenascin_isoform X1 [Hexamita inflata]|uniref:Tenascin isoform X1 n=1 Tax=Hexamita inflata TaxID=28002 RepID=A0AA86UXY0_9EUKA|nr:tenascin isoform X1 [Hexamita inflata]CAI9972414.1 tenascin isoform X1 [Hexamita inflata]
MMQLMYISIQLYTRESCMNMYQDSFNRNECCKQIQSDLRYFPPNNCGNCVGQLQIVLGELICVCQDEYCCQTLGEQNHYLDGQCKSCQNEGCCQQISPNVHYVNNLCQVCNDELCCQQVDRRLHLINGACISCPQNTEFDSGYKMCVCSNEQCCQAQSSVTHFIHNSCRTCSTEQCCQQYNANHHFINSNCEPCPIYSAFDGEKCRQISCTSEQCCSQHLLHYVNNSCSSCPELFINNKCVLCSEFGDSKYVNNQCVCQNGAGINKVCKNCGQNGCNSCGNGQKTGGDISEMEIYNYEFYKLLLLCYLETIQKKWSQFQRCIIYCNLQNLQEYKYVIIIIFQHILTIIRFTTINAEQRHQLSQGE